MISASTEFEPHNLLRDSEASETVSGVCRTLNTRLLET